VTYPITSALRGLAGVKAVRAQSMFGFSLVYAIFEDDVEFYFARSRVNEKLPLVTLPAGVKALLGPEGTGVGHVFWYTVENGWYCVPIYVKNVASVQVGPDFRRGALEKGGRKPWAAWSWRATG